jgi:hypothetical protein
MSENVIFFGWNQAIQGREKMSADHFVEFVEFLTGLQKKGTIQSFDPVFLDFHGGDMNGFFLIKGEGKKLEGLTDSEDWIRHTTRASFHLQGFGIVRGVTGDVLNERMQLWTKNIPD